MDYVVQLSDAIKAIIAQGTQKPTEEPRTHSDWGAGTLPCSYPDYCQFCAEEDSRDDRED